MRRALSTLLLLLFSFCASAESGQQVHSCAPDGIAVGGYDLVSYHQDGGPLPGSTEFAVEHGDLTYLFNNTDNLDSFRSDPEKYLPTYRGWCAASLAMGRLVCPDYTNFKIEGGRLLLFELAGFTNGRSIWDSDPKGFRQRADANFIKLAQ